MMVRENLQTCTIVLEISFDLKSVAIQTQGNLLILK